MITILVTGGNGQLATCFKGVIKNRTDFNVIYAGSQELDITDLKQVKVFFQSKSQIHYCINCAAYTAVDFAEKNKEKAYLINTLGAKNLALVCKHHSSVLIHISTDFVFDGNKMAPYNETDQTNPISVYGDTKLQGEIEIKQILKQHFIIRTSWLYSEYGNNFMKTMLRLSKDRDELCVVSDQVGSPTYAGDLAQVMLHIIDIKSQDYGLYHYSNLGEISWLDFARAIFKENQIEINLIAIKTEDYGTLAKRPLYSVLDKSKIKNTLNLEIPYWNDSLKRVNLNTKTN